MDLSTVKLTATSVSLMLNVADTTVIYWCKKGKVRYEQKGPSRAYYIYANSLVDFLYRNPKYANPYLKQGTRGITYMLQAAIQSELGKRPKSYSVKQIADYYCLTENAIRYWEAAGLLKNTARKEGVHGIFEKDLKDFFKNNPGFVKRYILREGDECYEGNDGYIAI